MSVTRLELSDERAQTTTPFRAALARKPGALAYFYVVMAGMALFLSWAVTELIGVITSPEQFHDGMIFIPLGTAVVVSSVFLAFFGMAFFKATHVVEADAKGIRYRLLVGKRPVIRTSTAWSDIRDLSLQPSAATGRVRYTTSVGPAYMGIGLDDDEAGRLLESLQSLSGQARHA